MLQSLKPLPEDLYICKKIVLSTGKPDNPGSSQSSYNSFPTIMLLLEGQIYGSLDEYTWV